MINQRPLELFSSFGILVLMLLILLLRLRVEASVNQGNSEAQGNSSNKKGLVLNVGCTCFLIKWNVA